MSVPLELHLVFHPASPSARALAVAIEQALNDPALPGLNVPTRIVREDGSGFPPAHHPLDTAEHSVVVLLADARFVLDEDVPAGRETWADFAAGLAARCDGTRHRFIPFQLSEAAWDFHDAFENISFARAWREPAETRTAWVVRRLVIELDRFLLGVERGERAPITLFISHAKADIGKPDAPFDALVRHLDATKPVKTWIDSAEIEAGSSFVERIDEGVADAALLVLSTQTFSTRSWCRKEVLLAKKLGRPMMVVDALNGLNQRAFPYLGNVPVLDWHPGAEEEAVDLLLKEVLRHTLTRWSLARHARPGDVVLPGAPEVLTVSALPPGTQVLYPDPPIDAAERLVVEVHGHKVRTPLQRTAESSPFRGRKVALSISESGDSERYGMLPTRLDAALLEITRHLMVGGAILAYGGHLGAEGYTRALFDLRDAQIENHRLPRTERILNYVGWPLPYASMKDEERAKLQRHLRFVRVPRPDGVADLEPETFLDEPAAFFPASSPARRYAWARGMTAMRERQTADTAARVILGGKVGPTVTVQGDGTRKVAWPSSRIPGVFEEALLSLRAQHPHRVYVLGAWGGVAAAVAELLEGGDRADLDWSYQKDAPHAVEMREIYTQRGVLFEDYPEMKQWLRDFGVAGLSANNRLTVDENRELFACSDIFRVVELVLQGLGRG